MGLESQKGMCSRKNEKEVHNYGRWFHIVKESRGLWGKRGKEWLLSKKYGNESDSLERDIDDGSVWIYCVSRSRISGLKGMYNFDHCPLKLTRQFIYLSTMCLFIHPTVNTEFSWSQIHAHLDFTNSECNDHALSIYEHLGRNEVMSFLLRLLLYLGHIFLLQLLTAQAGTFERCWSWGNPILIIFIICLKGNLLFWVGCRKFLYHLGHPLF